MADTSYPFDGQTINEAEWSKFARLFLGDGVVAFPASVGTGYNTPLSVFADSSGMQVKTRAGVCAVQGFYFERSTDNTVIAIGSNSSGSTRIDRIVAKLDRANNLISIVAKQGTTSPPSLQQDATIWEMSLAQVSVANGAATLAAATVTDERRFARRPGDLALGLVAAPKFATNFPGYVSSQTKDSSIGDITFTADPSAYYRIVYNSEVGTDTASTAITVYVRDGGLSSPTTGSTLVAQAAMRIATSTGGGEMHLCLNDIVGPSLNDSFTAGVHTLGVFYAATSGAGSVCPSSTASNPRSFSVEHLGYVI